MTAPARPTTNRALRRPLAIASVLALTGGLALGFAPAAGANNLRQLALRGSDPLACTDDNLDSLARASGGELHTLVKDGQCYVVHRFSESGDFTITSKTRFEMLIMVIGGGGGGGAGSGWEDPHKASGAEPESAAGAGGGSGSVRTARGMFIPDPGYSTANGLGEFDGFGSTVSDGHGGTLDGAPARGTVTYTPTKRDRNTASFSEPDGEGFSTPVGQTFGQGGYMVVSIGQGGDGGAAGTSTSGATVGGRGGKGGDSSFGELIAGGGTGGFGGGGTNGGSGDEQVGVASDPRAGGQLGGSNQFFGGGDVGSDHPGGLVLHAAPGGAGASEAGKTPVVVDAVHQVGDGGDGGDGISTDVFSSFPAVFACGGGGGTLSSTSAMRYYGVSTTGGKGGDVDSCGGDGSAGGDGKDAPGSCFGQPPTPGRGGCGGAGDVETPEIGSGGGGGGGDESVTPGVSTAGTGGRGGDGGLFVRYPALTSPATPAAPSAVAGNGSATLTIEPLADTPDYYQLWVAGDPDKTCTITPPEISCVIDGLTNGESYTFLAAAGNAAGYSPASAESLEITPDINAGMLPYTGNNTRGLASLALTMIGLGGAITLLTRRRRTIA